MGVQNDDIRLNTMKDNLVFTRNLIWGASSVTLAVAIPVWAIIGTFYAVRRIFGID